jgi:hypothetical protein
LRRRAVALLLAVGLVGCGRSPAEQLSTALEGVLSWIATARMVADHWLAGRAPRRYTRATLQAALESLEQERASLTSAPQSVADDQIEKALPVIERIEVAVARAWEAVGKGDPSAVREQRQALDGLESQLRALGARGTTP